MTTLIAMLRGLAAAASAASLAASAAATTFYFNGFETDIAGWDVFSAALHPLRVSSGTNGIPSASGSWHAENAPTSAGNWGGYGFNPGCATSGCAAALFPSNGYITRVDIYLDVAGGWANNTRFDLSSAISTPGGMHRRDFIFNAGFFNDSDGSPGSGTNRFIVSASNNSQPGSANPKNPARDPIAIGTTGWYTFEHFFRDNGGVLQVGMTIYNSGGSAVHTWTLSDPTDTININVGGNRYGWFDFNEFTPLAFDNAELILDPAGELRLEAPNWAPDADPGPGYQVEVELWARNLSGPVSGFQAFMDYDLARLDFRPDLSSYDSTIFDSHFAAIASAEGPAGFLKLDGNTFAAGGPDSTTADSLLATLVFDVLVQCDTAIDTMEFVPYLIFDSELSYFGTPLDTTLVDLPIITLDNEPPMITCPPNVVVECDESTAPANTGTATATDNCDASPTITYTDVVTPGACPQAQTITRTWKATDDCSLFSTCVQTITVVDTTLPVITCPDSVVVVADAGGCTAVLDPLSPSTPSAPIVLGGLAAVVPSGGPNGRSLSLESDISASEFSFGSWTPTRSFTLSQLTALSADFNMQSGCFGCGSPRFSIRVDADSDGLVSAGDCNVFVHWGTSPGFVDCPPLATWGSTGNLVTDGVTRWDSTQCLGPYYGTFADAVTAAGTDQVLRISVVADGGSGGCSGGHHLWVDNWLIGWAGDQTLVTFDNTTAASDNCDFSPTIACTRSDSLDLDDPYPAFTTVTCTATDDCGNVSMCSYTVTVLQVNEVNVVVDLPGSDPVVGRCIHFATNGCGAEANAFLDFVDHDANLLTAVRAVATIEIPCDLWTSLCAKDEQHTKWAVPPSPLIITGTQYTATLVLTLEPGDNDNDGDVDINDVTWLIATYGEFANPGCGTPRDADYSNNGAVSGEDYSLLSGEFLSFSSCPACPTPLDGGEEGKAGEDPPSLDRRTRLSTAQLAPHLRRADLDRDGFVDWRDAAIFEERHGLVPDLSRMLRTAR